MDSINKNQEEHNMKDLQGKEAAAKIKELAETAGTCFFCTNLQKGKAFSTRPMGIIKVDNEGDLWFLSANDSDKNAEIAADPNVQLLCQGSPHSDFLSIFGTATITTDKAKIKELWTPIAKDWFTEGENDPRITVIKVEMKQGYYWDTVHGRIVSLIKIVAGAIIGKTMDDSIEGKLKA